ncbi:flagellar protein FlaG [Pseudomonas oryzihabitans]|uniref:Flagellar protein FlaG n=1 Tax=Pseudomonas oryzihabitans TaxID=47885 RepID=A0AAJ2BKV5_9PSED|nr:flagellar protein FlaG [Pseudomonas psychrotolerans]MDR6236073.1 flagellar protein FlaG [Pseudomonas psychrotolerans]MDR6354610.1 flagellar protein FlaG [Pseudomonas psychrotolerans]
MDIVKTAGFSAVTPYGGHSGAQAAASGSDSTTSETSVAASLRPPKDHQAATATDTKVKAEEGGDVDDALSKLKAKFQDEHRNLDFSVDDSTGEMVVKVLDGESGKLIRQIPSEEVLKLAKQLDDVRSLMFKAKA